MKIRVIRGKTVMNQFLLKAQTAWNLGPVSLARYFRYQIGVRARLNPVQRLQAKTPTAPFFRQPEQIDPQLSPPQNWNETARYFGWYEVAWPGRFPTWHHNPFTGATLPDPDRPWWQIPDFDPQVGDIKTIWEASRFDWVITNACRARAGDGEAVDRLNDWLADWLRHNPPYFGPNWKCGQETSIRVMHLAMAALLLGQMADPPTGLADLVRLHLQRIVPTIQYALAQNNNHGTSEAAALFIGGSWLSQATGEKEAKKWARDGRYWLEDRAQTLIAADGSFSQHAVNYHRLLLDTLSMVEIWRRHSQLAPFSTQWRQRAQAATRWLYAFADPATGMAPNIGANDGARLLPIEESDYGDYRPSAQLAATLFLEMDAYGPGPWNQKLAWLGVDRPQQRLESPSSQLFDDGGFAILVNERARVFIRYPRYRFRPGHADALHVDLWLDHENFLRDAGSYSYAAESQWQTYFRSCAAHNTVQFDGRDQMPRLSRFLYAAWLKTSQRELTPTGAGHSFKAAYQDWLGASHQRQVELQPMALNVTDHLSGFKEKAVLRWRLLPGAWQKTEDGVSNGRATIQVTTDVPIVRQEIVGGWESRYYMQREPIPVLEVEIVQPGRLQTIISW